MSASRFLLQFYDNLWSTGSVDGSEERTIHNNLSHGIVIVVHTGSRRSRTGVPVMSQAGNTRNMFEALLHMNHRLALQCWDPVQVETLLLSNFVLLRFCRAWSRLRRVTSERTTIRLFRPITMSKQESVAEKMDEATKNVAIKKASIWKASENFLWPNNVRLAWLV